MDEEEVGEEEEVKYKDVVAATEEEEGAFGAMRESDGWTLKIFAGKRNGFGV